MAEPLPSRAAGSALLVFPDAVTQANRDRLHTVMFDDEDEYVRFTDHVWDQIDENGIELSDVPIRLSIRVPRWILEETRGRFALRLVTPEDVQQAVEGLLEQKRQGRKPFDPASLGGFHVPGVSRAPRRR